MPDPSSGSSSAELGDRAAILVLEGKVGEGDTIVVDAADGTFDVHAREGSAALA